MSPKSLEPRRSREEQKQRSRDRMINLLFQAIIAANPHHDPRTTPEARLAKVREALFGEKPSRGRKPIKEELKLFPLFHEALKAETAKIMRLVKSRQKSEVQTEWERLLLEEEPSLRGIAKKHAADFAKSSIQYDSTVDWLRRQVLEIPLTSQDMADLEGLFYGDSPKAQRLQRIFDELKALGIDAISPFGTKSNE